ncbi:hypothetical protein ACF0H5_020681 [Mactra antiquata]
MIILCKNCDNSVTAKIHHFPNVEAVMLTRAPGQGIICLCGVQTSNHPDKVFQCEVPVTLTFDPGASESIGYVLHPRAIHSKDLVNLGSAIVDYRPDKVFPCEVPVTLTVDPGVSGSIGKSFDQTAIHSKDLVNIGTAFVELLSGQGFPV